MYVVSDRVLRPLDTDQILTISRSSGHREPIVFFVALILVTLAEIPAENKVLGNIVNTRANETHTNIMPRHTRGIERTDSIVSIITDILTTMY